MLSVSTSLRRFKTGLLSPKEGYLHNFLFTILKRSYLSAAHKAEIIVFHNVLSLKIILSLKHLKAYLHIRVPHMNSAGCKILRQE